MTASSVSAPRSNAGPFSRQRTKSSNSLAVQSFPGSPAATSTLSSCECSSTTFDSKGASALSDVLDLVVGSVVALRAVGLDGATPVPAGGHVGV